MIKLRLLLLISVFFIACEDETPLEEESIFASCCSTNAINAQVGTGKIYVPNIITPNDDGINDRLEVYSSEEISIINKLEIKKGDTTIYLINDFLPDNYNSVYNWNGRRSGSAVSGVFSVIVTVTDENGTEATLMGEVCSLPCDPTNDPIMTFEDLNNCKFGTQHDGQGRYDEDLPTFEELECLE